MGTQFTTGISTAQAGPDAGVAAAEDAIEDLVAAAADVCQVLC
jgi:hypothetical protein